MLRTLAVVMLDGRIGTLMPTGKITKLFSISQKRSKEMAFN